MIRNVHTVGRNDRLAVADALMKQARIRHLPVLDSDGAVVEGVKLVGLVTETDFVGLIAKGR